MNVYKIRDKRYGHYFSPSTGPVNGKKYFGECSVNKAMKYLERRIEKIKKHSPDADISDYEIIRVGEIDND